jgi:ceramide glucosyltransferase
MAFLAILLLAVSLTLMAVHLASLALALPRLRGGPPMRPVPPDAPRITVLRPFKGLEYRLEETLGSSLTLDYPGCQVLFCVDDAEDPAVPLVRRLIAEHPDVDAQLLIGRDPVSRNPKINNLLKGWRAADGEFVAMADSNIILPPDYLSQLLSRWDAQTGLVTSPAAGIDPQGFGAALECAFLNGYQARWQIAGDQIGLGYAQGKTLFWKRAFLDAAGGPAPLGDSIAEDAASTRLVRSAGLKVHLAHRPFAQPVGRRTVATVWKRQLRWAIIRRVAFPGLFLTEPLSTGAVPFLLFALGAAAGGLSAGLVVVYPVLWYGAEWWLVRLAGWPAGAQIVAASLLRDAMSPLLWALAWTRSSFDWQGNAVGTMGKDGQ